MSTATLDRPVQASDISDTVALAAVSAEALFDRTASLWRVADRLPFPEKVVLAKLRKLTRRGLLAGCYCGCRGDFQMTPKGIMTLLEVSE